MLLSDQVREIREFCEENLDEIARDYVAWCDDPRGIIAPGSRLATARDLHSGTHAYSLPFVTGVILELVVRKYVEKLERSE